MMLLAPSGYTIPSQRHAEGKEQLGLYSNPQFESYCLDLNSPLHYIPMSRADFEACPWQRVNSYRKQKLWKRASLCFRPGFVRISNSAPHVKHVEFKESIPRALFLCFIRLETRIAWMGRYNPTYEQKRDLFLAMAMGLRPRLGRNSPARALDDEILRLIFRNLTLA